MPQIGNTTIYPKQTPSINDYLIGTDGDVNNKRTHNYSIKDLVTLFLENSDIEGIIQNNKAKLKQIGQIDVASNIAEAVNALPEFEIGEQEVFVFTCSKYKPAANNGSQRVPGTPVDTDMFFYKYLFTLGKGFYGISVSNPTTTVGLIDFIEIEQIVVRVPSSTESDPIIYTVPNTGRLSAVNAINTAGTYAVASGADVYFVVYNVDGTSTTITYRFVGAAGTYGIGATQVVAGNLLTLEEAGIQPNPTTSIKIVESIPLFITSGSTMASVVNNLPSFTVTENQLYVFNFRTQKTDVNGKVYIESASHFLKKGKGLYGQAGPTNQSLLTNADFKLNFKESVYSTETTKDITYYNLDRSDEADVVDAINTSETAIVKNSTYTTVIEKDGVSYEFIGANGSYGDGLLQATSGDLSELVELDYNTEDLKEEILDAVLSEEHTFAEKITFDKLIKLTSQATLPTPESGMVVNHNNELRFYNGTGWYTLDMTPYGV